MIEEKNNALREAIRQEETVRPQMPKDLNARLMQRVEKEVNETPKHSLRIWPWIAAACVAAVIVIFLTPPKEGVEGQGVAKVEQDTTKQQTEMVKEEADNTLLAQNEVSTQKEVAAKVEKVLKTGTSKTVKEEEIAKVEDTLDENIIALAETPAAKPQPRVISDRDLPITRPENLKYTKEELALLKQQANEAYLKWAELELEIAKYNMEQTAQN